MSDRTNVYRAERAFKALQAYKAVEGETCGDISEDIVDLLTDLHHYTRANSLLSISTTNKQRAERAFKALQAYKAVEGETCGDISEDIVDLLTDLHHYIRANSLLSISTEEAVQAMANMMVSAVSHYDAEA